MFADNEKDTIIVVTLSVSAYQPLIYDSLIRTSFNKKKKKIKGFTIEDNSWL